jgi:heme exporter protein CcmD
MSILLHHCSMGGYGGYVFSAYGITLLLLGLQWYRAWRRKS